MRVALSASGLLPSGPWSPAAERDRLCLAGACVWVVSVVVPTRRHRQRGPCSSMARLALCEHAGRPGTLSLEGWTGALGPRVVLDPAGEVEAEVLGSREQLMGYLCAGTSLPSHPEGARGCGRSRRGVGVRDPWALREARAQVGSASPAASLLPGVTTGLPKPLKK